MVSPQMLITPGVHNCIKIVVHQKSGAGEKDVGVSGKIQTNIMYYLSRPLIEIHKYVY